MELRKKPFSVPTKHRDSADKKLYVGSLKDWNIIKNYIKPIIEGYILCDRTIQLQVLVLQPL
jgi:hypothetical protein